MGTISTILSYIIRDQLRIVLMNMKVLQVILLRIIDLNQVRLTI